MQSLSVNRRGVKRMGDLISRLVYKSDLLKMVGVLNKQYRKAILDGDNDLILAIQNKQSAYTTALRLLDYEPTAYDSRKVIEELEKAIEIIKQNGTSEDVYEKIQIQAYNKAIDDFVKFANTMPTIESEDGEIRPMWLEEMAEKLKVGTNNDKSI